jgi:hypothetical protein
MTFFSPMPELIVYKAYIRDLHAPLEVLHMLPKLDKIVIKFQNGMALQSRVQQASSPTGL